MKIVRSSIIPFKGFIAINLFGIIFIRKEVRPHYNISMQEYDTLLLHEYIHTKQMRELLYLAFYLWYIIEWLVRLAMYRDMNKAYRNISFEREAYENQRNRSYIQERERFAFLKHIRG